jgi:hypothetical protein
MDSYTTKFKNTKFNKSSRRLNKNKQRQIVCDPNNIIDDNEKSDKQIIYISQILDHQLKINSNKDFSWNNPDKPITHVDNYNKDFPSL